MAVAVGGAASERSSERSWGRERARARARARERERERGRGGREREGGGEKEGIVSPHTVAHTQKHTRSVTRSRALARSLIVYSATARLPIGDCTQHIHACTANSAAVVWPCSNNQVSAWYLKDRCDNVRKSMDQRDNVWFFQLTSTNKDKVMNHWKIYQTFSTKFRWWSQMNSKCRINAYIYS